MEDTFESKFRSFENKLTKLLPTIAVILIAIWWVFYGMVEIVPTELSITERVGLVICTSVVAICYSSLIADGGFQSAKDTDKYKTARSKWYESTKKALPYKKEVSMFAEDIAKQNRVDARTKTLESVGLKYDEIFDKKDNLIVVGYKYNKYNKKKNPTGYYKEQIKAIRYCTHIHLFVPDVLAATIDSVKFGLKKQVSEDAFRKKNISFRTLIKLITSIFVTGIMVVYLGLTIESVIYAIFQIALWTGTGVFERQGNYNFIIDKIVPQIIDNTLIIDGFLEKQKLETPQVIEEKEKTD